MAKDRNFVELYELLERTGFVFNPIITYAGSYFFKTGSLSDILRYSAGQDVFVLNSKNDNGKNRYIEFCRKNFVNVFGNPPSKAIAPAIIPLLMSDMKEDGRGREVKFSYTPTLLVLLEDAELVSDAPDDEVQLALYVKDQIKNRRDKMFNVLRMWDKSPYYKEFKEKYESHGYKMTYEFLEKQKDYFTKLIFLLKDVSKECSKNRFDEEAFVECFDRDKLILILCKCIVDLCRESARDEGAFQNCIIEVIQLIKNIKDLGLDNLFNPIIKYYDSEKEKYRFYTFEEMKKEVAQMLSEYPDFDIAAVEYDTAVSYDMVRNEEATRRYVEIMTEIKKQKLSANWEFVRPGEKEDKTTANEVYLTKENRKKIVTQSGKDAYLELMRKRMFFEQTNYMEKIIGINNFEGYIGYIYPNGLVIFEKMYDDSKCSVPVSISNATYVMNIDNFVELSSMTKTEIIKYIKDSSNPNVVRLYHSKGWEQKLTNIIDGVNYEDVMGKINELIKAGKVRKENKDLEMGKGKK